MTQRKLPWRELVLMAGFYLLFALFYMVVIKWSMADVREKPEGIFEYLNWLVIYVDYPLKALFTVPIWYLTFRVLRPWPIWSKVLVDLVMLPIWVKSWQWTYYWLTDDVIGGGHLRGGGEWWDVYIPTIFYLLQFGIFHAYAYYQDLRRTELARAESERLALASELNALKAQLNPHFLYNAFNTIAASATGPGQERTRDMIAQLSDLFRYQLRANRVERLPLGDEIDFITDYLELEKARFGERINYRIEVPDELRHALLPPLLLQPLVENAARHGLGPRVEGGTVTLRATSDGAYLTLTVEDDGAGFDPSTVDKSYGLRNTERRLRLHFQTSLHLRSAPNEGTLCTFTIPLTYAPESTADRRRSPRPDYAAGVPG